MTEVAVQDCLTLVYIVIANTIFALNANSHGSLHEHELRDFPFIHTRAFTNSSGTRGAIVDRSNGGPRRRPVDDRK
jgi:hypothetical protein